MKKHTLDITQNISKILHCNPVQSVGTDTQLTTQKWLISKNTVQKVGCAVSVPASLSLTENGQQNAISQ